MERLHKRATYQKAKEFIKANCFDKNSKIFYNLTNGKSVTFTTY
jgi:hypothetical protein